MLVPTFHHVLIYHIHMFKKYIARIDIYLPGTNAAVVLLTILKIKFLLSAFLPVSGDSHDILHIKLFYNSCQTDGLQFLLRRRKFQGRHLPSVRKEGDILSLSLLSRFSMAFLANFFCKMCG